ncbi:hypothetical protein [Dyadobacter sp. LHD-138]|uniref:hypothetical protein n=1 Tax=Dyadobacter sp. LHD-138 TaxID=3071413 RepID=UPI0027DF586E|nr:hypothetical protein [Dyadobacter sp. LHD-138]MDQ6481700.1 hypothetical protein [Dyadobacter sp. LHD-138]
MNLHASFKYPLLKYLSEEFQGSFFQNEVTCLNRMLILYHNRYSFSIDDNTADYVDNFERYLQKPLNFWYLPAAKRQQINLIRNRMLYLLENNRSIYAQLLARKDYSAFEAKQETILKIYQWLQTLPHEPAVKSGIDINQWKKSASLSSFYLNIAGSLICILFSRIVPKPVLPTLSRATKRLLFQIR